MIAAGLVEVGQGRMTPAQFKNILEKGDRSALPVEAAPAHGLYLTQVRGGRTRSLPRHSGLRSHKGCLHWLLGWGV